MQRRESESHSDSDSGDSWTLLDSAPSYIAPGSSPPSSALHAAQPYREGAEKDDDTDGISIISECESETKESYEYVQQDDRARVVAVAPRPVEQDSDDATDYQHLLGDATELKTYVHRRNTRVSSTLNVILLGSVVTAACLAIGHMWGVRDDCAHQHSASVNKLLSNLYKLQEENAYLRSKLKELTLAGHGQLHLKRNSTPKQCKKTLEEPLQRADDVSTDKCVDPDADIDRPLLKYVKTELTLPSYPVEIDESEKEFQNDLQKLRNLYKENRIWLERHLTKRLKNEKDLASGQVERPSTQQNANAEISENSVDGGEEVRDESKLRAATHADRLERDRTKESQRASSAKEKHKQKLKHETPDDDSSPPKEKRSKKLKREQYNSERYKRPDTKIESDDRYENNYEVENRSGHNNVKNRDKVGSRDNKYSADYDMHLNYIGRFSNSDRQNPKKRKKDSKTNFVIVDRESDESKKKKNGSVGTVVGDWLEKRSAMRRRARQEAHALAPRLRARASARWYFQLMREREQLRARSAHNPRTLYTKPH